MRKTALLAAGLLSAIIMVGFAPAASASTATASTANVSTAAADSASVLVSDAPPSAEVPRPDCKSVLYTNAHKLTCRGSAPGNQFRALVKCSNGNWYAGPWRRQTSDFSTTSTAVCPGSTHRTDQGGEFRTV